MTVISGLQFSSKMHNFKTPEKGHPFVLSVSSGKGGVGKTLTVVNMAISASLLGYKVAILDGDLGMSNVDIVLGLQSRYNIKDVLSGWAKFEDIVLEGPLGLKVISSGSGLSSLQNLSSFEKHIITENLKKLSQTIDLLIIDTGAGIGDNVLHLNSLSHKTLVVTTPEPHALTDAYALIKVLSKEKNIQEFDLLVNLTCDDKEGEKIAKKLSQAALSFLGVAINYVGCVPCDSSLSKSLIRREYQKLLGCHTHSGQAWKKITQKYLSRRSFKNEKSFFESLGG